MKILTATKLKLAFSALVVAGATTAFVNQHQAQNKLRAENDSLAQQITQLRSDNGTLSNHFTEIGEAKSLTDEQMIELLKLRGEVGVLRRHVGEIEKSHEESQINQTSTAIHFQNHKDAIREMPQVALAMRLCAIDNNWQYPSNFDQLKTELEKSGKNWLLSTNFATLPELRKGNVQLSAFEFVNEGLVLHEGLLDHRIIVLRERAPYQNPDGKWERIYGLEDASTEIQISDDGNFTAYEKLHMVSPLNQ